MHDAEFNMLKSVSPVHLSIFPAAAAGGPLRVAYFVNQYPKVSHTFIRREIAALERLGVVVERFALRGWDAEVVDPEDVAEIGRTRFLLQGRPIRLVLEAVLSFLRRPSLGFKALRLALAMSRHADRPWPLHLIYLLEAHRLVAWLRSSKVVHVHAHFGTNSAEVVMLANALGGPSFSFTTHGPEEFDKPQFLGLAHKTARAAFVVAISSFGRSQLWRWMPAEDWHKVKVIHCGLEAQFFASAAELSVEPAQRLVCVGRLCEQKGQLLLVQAAAVLAAAGVDFELVLAGDGEMRVELERAIKVAGLQQRVRITGWIGSEQVRQELMASRALVLPSFAEGLPVVIMEAMAIGRPVISTYIAGIPELVRPGVDGWLVPAGDPEALANAMLDCLSATPERLAEMGRSAHARVVERHHIDTEAVKLKSQFAAAKGLS